MPRDCPLCRRLLCSPCILVCLLFCSTLLSSKMSSSDGDLSRRLAQASLNRFRNQELVQGGGDDGREHLDPSIAQCLHHLERCRALCQAVANNFTQKPHRLLLRPTLLLQQTLKQLPQPAVHVYLTTRTRSRSRKFLSRLGVQSCRAT